MPVQNISILREPEKALAEALRTIEKGGILLFPTESVYGIGVDSGNPSAIEKLSKLKGRPEGKPFQRLAADVEWVRRLSVWDERAEKLAKTFWPGPLTMVVPEKNGGSIGWRAPRHDWLLKLLKRLARPLVATSANLAGKPPPISFDQALGPFKNSISLALDGGEIRGGVESTVVSLLEKKIELLRAGAISREALFRALKIQPKQPSVKP